MDEEPWREPDDERWEMPRSWQEVRERWHSDTALRAAIRIAVVLTVIVLWTCSGLRR